MQQLHRHPMRFPSVWRVVASDRRVSFAPNVLEPLGNARSRLASYLAARSSIVGALAELSTTSDERDRSRACAIVTGRCFLRSPGINYRYAPTDVVVVIPHGASLKHAPLADALLRDAWHSFVSDWTLISPVSMSGKDFIAHGRWFWKKMTVTLREAWFSVRVGIDEMYSDDWLKNLIAETA